MILQYGVINLAYIFKLINDPFPNRIPFKMTFILESLTIKKRKEKNKRKKKLKNN